MRFIKDLGKELRQAGVRFFNEISMVGINLSN